MLGDVDDLHETLGDARSMRFYPHPFSRDEVVSWIEWAPRSYAERGYGLWGLVLKDSAENEPSAGVARNLGMTVWKETMRAGFRHHVFSITRDEWASCD